MMMITAHFENSNYSYASMLCNLFKELKGQHHSDLDSFMNLLSHVFKAEMHNQNMNVSHSTHCSLHPTLQNCQ